jgi:hypothetical protein
MIKRISILSLLLVIISFNSLVLAQQSKKIRVLFMGNSYTYVNNLPLLIKDIASSNGDTLLYDSNCPGGQTFNGHFIDPTTVTKLMAQPWHHVVLQAQSQEPSFPPAQVASQTLPYAIKLDSMIKHYIPCAETVFFETWGRKNGDASNCPFYTPLCTYLGMQNRLRASYKLFADSTHGVFSPVGEAFKKSIALNPSLELYSLDESHPSLEGSYLAACVFYEVLFHKSVLTTTYTAGVSLTNSIFLKQIAHSVVRDSLSTWNIGKYTPYAPFTASLISALNYQFNGYSNTLSNKWYFGDGTTSLFSNPNHTYSVSQTYTVSHVVTTGCKKDSSSYILSPIILDVSQSASKENSFSIFPNPVNKEFSIIPFASFNSTITYIIYDNAGNECMKGTTSNLVNVEKLTNGVYFIGIRDEEKLHYFKFIKSGQ